MPFLGCDINKGPPLAYLQINKASVGVCARRPPATRGARGEMVAGSGAAVAARAAEHSRSSKARAKRKPEQKQMARVMECPWTWPFWHEDASLVYLAAKACVEETNGAWI
jgi:hypothetical protein